MNFSYPPGREFILPSGQGISHSWNLSYPIWISHSGNFLFMELPYMNFSFREFLIRGIYHTLYEFIIQGIYPPSGQGIYPPIRAGNLSFREFMIQEISDSGNFSSLRVREFLLPPGQRISPPSGSENFSSLRVREFLIREFIIPYMNLSFREFLIRGIYHTLYEFIIQGIYPPIRAGNLSFREFMIQEISDSGNFSFGGISPPSGSGEFILQWIYHPSGSGNYPIWISHSGNFSFREFIIPPGQGISHPLRAGNFSSLRVREFILPPGQGIYPPSGSGNFSFKEFIIPYMNFSFREFIIPYMNFSFREFIIPLYEFLLPPGQGISPPSGASRGGGNFSSLRGLQGRREFLLPPGPPGEAGISPPSGASRGGGNLSFGGIYPSENLSYLYEFLIQGIYHTLIWITHIGNLSSHPGSEFIIQGISDSGNFWFREFLIRGNLSSHSGMEFILQGIYPPYMNLSFMEFILPYMNFSSLRVREFFLRPGQEIYSPLRAGNLSYHIWISHSGNFSYPLWFSPSGNSLPGWEEKFIEDMRNFL